MFLAIDVGNTQTTLGLFDEKGRMLHGWRMSTRQICCMGACLRSS